MYHCWKTRNWMEMHSFTSLFFGFGGWNEMVGLNGACCFFLSFSVLLFIFFQDWKIFGISELCLPFTLHIWTDEKKRNVRAELCSSYWIFFQIQTSPVGKEFSRATFFLLIFLLHHVPFREEKRSYLFTFSIFIFGIFVFFWWLRLVFMCFGVHFLFGEAISVSVSLVRLLERSSEETKVEQL